MTSQQKTVLKIAAVLWFVWGIVHILAGVMTMSADLQTAIGNIADAVDKATLVGTYPNALSGILSQHGWNLAWIGLTTVVGSVMIWRAHLTAIWVTALVGGMADIGYFLFLDLPGHVNFMPGTLMTIFSGTAIVLSGWVWWSMRTVNHSK